jgi:hypothetical protein
MEFKRILGLLALGMLISAGNIYCQEGPQDASSAKPTWSDRLNAHRAGLQESKVSNLISFLFSILSVPLLTNTKILYEIDQYRSKLDQHSSGLDQFRSRLDQLQSRLGKLKSGTEVLNTTPTTAKPTMPKRSFWGFTHRGKRFTISTITYGLLSLVPAGFGIGHFVRHGLPEYREGYRNYFKNRKPNNIVART